MAKSEVDYKKLKEELDQIISDLSSSDYDIDQAIIKYKKAEAIIEKLEAYLKTAENKITDLKIKKAK